MDRLSAKWGMTMKFPILTEAAIEAYDHLSLPVWVFSTETLRILSSNSAARSWIGYDAATLQKMSIADLRPASDRAKIVKQVREFDGTQADAGKWTIVASSGAHYTAAFTWSKVTFEGARAIVASIRDVTRIEQAEARAEILNSENEALRLRAGLSAAQIAGLFDGLPGMLLVLTPGDYQIVAVTDDYAKGVMLDRDAMLGRSLFDLFPNDPAEPQADGMRNLRESLQRVEALRVVDVMNVQRYPVRLPDGAFQERFWMPRNKPVLDADGHVAYIIHRVEDVTAVVAESDFAHAATSSNDPVRVQQVFEMRTALLALQERETRLKTAEMLLDLGAWAHAIDLGTLDWSDRVFDIYGAPRALRAPNFDEYVARVHPDDRDQMLATYTDFIESGASEIDFVHRIIRDDGTITYVRGVGARHQVDNREMVVGFVQDVTANKLAEEELIIQARRRKLAGRLARLGSWRVDLQETHVSWCEVTADIHDEPEGTSPTLDQAISYYVPEHRDRIRTRFEACVTAGQPFTENLQIRTAKGRLVWVRALGEPIRDKSGAVIAVEGAFQDITDLMAVQSEASELSARLRRTLEGMSDAFFLLDEAWCITFVNSQAEEMLQRPTGDLVGKNLWQEYPEAVGSVFQANYERAVAEGCVIRFQEYFAPLNIWFEVIADPTPAGLAVYFRDVTQERGRASQLRLLEAAVAQLSDVVLITEAEPIDGPEGPKIVYVNDAFERRTGFSREEAIGNTPRMLQGPKTQRAELDKIRQSLENLQPVRSELINYTKSGEEFWLELGIVPLANEAGLLTHWIAVERDITARKEVEMALQSNEERFRLVTKAAGTAIWDFDIRNGNQWWSDGLRDIFGHTADRAGSGGSIWRTHVHPDDITAVDLAFKRLVSGQDNIMRKQYRFQRADATWAFVEDQAFALRDDDGQVCRILGSVTDISEKVLLEDRLRQAQKMETVGQMTGGIAHDFNNLLTIILGNAEILEEELQRVPHLQRLARMSLDAADRGAELTSRLLAYSRKQSLEPKVLDVGLLIQNSDSLLRRTLPENIEIEIVRGSRLWKIEADAAQLESALLNLALNARDAMSAGGSLIIEAANATLDDDWVTMASEPDFTPGQYVMVAVTDTGQGIAPDAMSRIFEPFFTTKEVGMGSGLGLSMVFGFVKQSGGHIRVYSELNEGTSIKMYFPRSLAKQEDTVTDRTERNVMGGSETILVVEDDSAVREYVTAQIQGLGYRVLQASAGAEAMEILNKSPEINLLFTDIVMPGGMDGRELADAALKTRPSLKVLFTSGYTENSIVHHGRLDPGVKLLSKPYRREQLAAKIRETLDDGAPNS